MEEKERYEWNSRFDEAIKDNQTGDIVNAVEVLNKQDKRIKELEEENNFLEKRNEELIIDRRDICLERNDIFEENQQLKQQLAEKEKEIENLNNRILISQLQAPEEQRLKIIGSSCCQYNPKQDKISFAVDILEELADCSNYINSKLDFESGSYVSEKSIRNKIKYLKGNKYE